jgi:hypothetical protein
MAIEADDRHRVTLAERVGIGIVEAFTRIVDRFFR